MAFLLLYYMTFFVPADMLKNGNVRNDVTEIVSDSDCLDDYHLSEVDLTRNL